MELENPVEKNATFTTFFEYYEKEKDIYISFTEDIQLPFTPYADMTKFKPTDQTDAVTIGPEKQRSVFMSNRTYQLLVIVAIALCGLVFIALIIILVVVCKRRRRQAKELSTVGIKIGNIQSAKHIEPVMGGALDEEAVPVEFSISANRSNSRLLVAAKVNQRRINYIVKPVFIDPEEQKE